MNSDNILWQGKSKSFKTAIMLLVFAVFMIAALVVAIVGKGILQTIMMVILILFIIASVVLFISIKHTSLKWESNRLFFRVTENGVYFSNNPSMDGFFFAEWADVAGYSIIQGKKGNTTVIVNLNIKADAGVMGKINYVKMVNITGADELCKIFETYDKKEMAYSKN